MNLIGIFVDFAGRPKAAILFSFLTVLLFFFFLALFIAVVSIMSVSSIVATCPSIQAARFAFCLCFIRFNFVVLRCFVW